LLILSLALGVDPLVRADSRIFYRSSPLLPEAQFQVSSATRASGWTGDYGRDRREQSLELTPSVVQLPRAARAQPGLRTSRPRTVRSLPVSFEVRNLSGSDTGAIMADKSPRQAASKKSGKSIKEKRADKKASSAPPSSMDKATSTKPASPKKK
jgi:hypothetical protein